MFMARLARVPTLRGTLFALALAAAALPAAACKQGGGKAAALPPAAGEGAPALPALPHVDDGKRSTFVAPTSGKTTGTTVAHTEAQIAANASGVIISLPVREGDVVAKGDLLFKQDARDALLRVRQARTALNAAQVGLKAAEADYARTKALLDQGATNRAIWDQVEARRDGAKVGVDQAKVALDMASKMVADTIVRAPFAGIIAAKLKSEGDMATMMPPTVVVVLQDLSTLDLHVRLPESALAHVRPGDPLTVHFAAIGVTREATIKRVTPAVDPRSRTVEIVAELANADLSLKPGLLAEVTMGASAKPAPHKGSGGTP